MNLDLSIVTGKNNGDTLLISDGPTNFCNIIVMNVPSSKNSRIFNIQRSMSFHSKTTQRYINVTKYAWSNKVAITAFKRCCENKHKPYKIGIHFIRDSRRKYDWINAVQIIQDLMVKNGWIDDDNTSEIIPFPMEVNGEYSSYIPNQGAVIFSLIN